MNQIQLTIITPSLNYGQYIDECLSSVADQQDEKIEHLVIDGGSEDETLNIAQNYPKLKFIQGEDSGMSEAINKGLRLAQGKWLMWLNADDRIKPGALKKFLLFADNHKDVDVIYGAWNFIDQNGFLEREMTLFPFQRQMLTHLGCYIGSTACFFRKKTTIDQGHFINEEFRYTMDGEYYVRLANLGLKFFYMPLIVADFRRHGKNLSLKNSLGSGISSKLELQKQWAEYRAIRREYGYTFFKNEHANAIVDSILYYYYLFKKGILKRWYAGRKNL